MVRCGHRTSETRCNLDGALPSNALSCETRPERAFVFLERGGEGAAPYSVESERLEPGREGEDPMRRTGRMRRSTLLLALTFAVEWYVAPLPLAAEHQPEPAVKVLLEKVVEVPSTPTRPSSAIRNCVRVKDSGAGTRGSTSVAVRTP